MAKYPALDQPFYKMKPIPVDNGRILRAVDDPFPITGMLGFNGLTNDYRKRAAARQATFNRARDESKQSDSNSNDKLPEGRKPHSGNPVSRSSLAKPRLPAAGENSSEDEDVPLAREVRHSKTAGKRTLDQSLSEDGDALTTDPHSTTDDQHEGSRAKRSRGDTVTQQSVALADSASLAPTQSLTEPNLSPLSSLPSLPPSSLPQPSQPRDDHITDDAMGGDEAEAEALRRATDEHREMIIRERTEQMSLQAADVSASSEMNTSDKAMDVDPSPATDAGDVPAVSSGGEVSPDTDALHSSSSQVTARPPSVQPPPLDHPDDIEMSTPSECQFCR